MNLETWNKLKQPPPSALKQINAGRLKGMSDINPQWRYQAMTEVFGICGVGWKYEIKKMWLEPVSENQVVAFCHIDLFISGPDGWSAGIPGIGGSMLIAKEKSGMHSSDEAYKMATTDALSVAMKMLGVGADIYMGRWDGSKYKNPQPQENPSIEKWSKLFTDLPAETTTREYIQWWTDNKEVIKKECGNEVAADVRRAVMDAANRVAVKS